MPWLDLHTEVLDLFREAQQLPVEIVRQSWARVEHRRESRQSWRERGRRNYRVRYRPQPFVAKCVVCGLEWSHRKRGSRPRHCSPECKVTAAIARRAEKRRVAAERDLANRRCIWCGGRIRRGRPRSGKLPSYCEKRCRERAKRCRLFGG